MTFQSKLIKLRKENELRSRHIFLPISVVMMSVQVFGLFLAIKKLKASIKRCEGKGEWVGLGAGGWRNRVCAQDIIVLAGWQNHWDVIMYDPPGAKAASLISLSFIRRRVAGSDPVFRWPRWVEQAAEEMTRVRPPLGSAARAKLQRSDSTARRKIEPESFREAGSSSAGRNPDFDIGSLHIKKH